MQNFKLLLIAVTLLGPTLSFGVPKTVIAREGDIAITELASPAFSNLPRERKLFVYNLAQAMRVSRDIYWSQASREGLAIRNLLSKMWPSIEEYKDKDLFTQYFFRILNEHRNYDKFKNAKIVPEFSRESLEDLVIAVALRLGDQGDAFLNEYIRLEGDIFDPDYRVSLLADASVDRVSNSNSNFYADGLDESKLGSLNLSFLSHVTIHNGEVLAQNPRIGGLFSEYLLAADKYLKRALRFATPSEKVFIQALRKAYREGTPESWQDAYVAWLKNKPDDIDFMLGFIEVYEDPMGERRAWEGWIMLLAKDPETEARVQTTRKHAQDFERSMPVDEEFKKTGDFAPPQAEGNDLLYASGRTGEQPFLGKNLFSEADLKQKYGSKSFTNLNMIENLTSEKALERLAPLYLEEYREALRSTDLNLMKRLATEFHEILGHGSGQKRIGVSDADLKELYSPIEEARAEIAYLYHITQDETYTYGILPAMNDQERRTFQTLAVLSFFTDHINGLHRIQKGTTTFRQAHQWARQALLNDLIAQGCLQIENTDLPRVKMTDFEHCQMSLGNIWKRIQSFVSTGDYDGSNVWLSEMGILKEDQVDWVEKLQAHMQTLNAAKYSITLNPLITKKKEVELGSRADQGYGLKSLINEYVQENQKTEEEIAALKCEKFLR